jgi:hypothetical protein
MMLGWANAEPTHARRTINVPTIPCRMLPLLRRHSSSPVSARADRAAQVLVILQLTGKDAQNYLIPTIGTVALGS